MPFEYLLDSHWHWIQPPFNFVQRFPISPKTVYQPTSRTLDNAVALQPTLAAGSVVFVQPSIYGTDNFYLLIALAKVGPFRGRGVVIVDPGTIQEETLDEWHTLGVRGLRVNFQSVGEVMDQSQLVNTAPARGDPSGPGLDHRALSPSCEGTYA